VSAFEIIVLDQSVDANTQKAIKKLNSNKIISISTHTKGKSVALNIGILHARGKIIAFTDDDCLVDTHWLETMLQSLKDTSIAGVFGNVLPYKPTQHRNEECPSTMEGPLTTVSKPCAHYKYLGFGNNMAFKKNALTQTGYFKTWLGPGSIGQAAEDGHIANTILYLGGRISHNPKMVVYHDKWLAPHLLRYQDARYSRGEAISYTYFFSQKQHSLGALLKQRLSDYRKRVGTTILPILRFSWNRHTVGSLYWAWKLFCVYVIGMGIGYYFSKADPLPSKIA